MKRVVVTGATSMIGVALIKECINNHVEVMAIVRRQSVNIDRLPKSDLIKIYECGLDDLKSISADDKSYDVFYHFAWDYTAKDQRDNPILQEKNIKFTLDAVELAKRLGCSKFIGAGSQAEYGKVDGMILPDTKTTPFLSYGIAKLAAGKLSEKLCREFGMVHIWGRIFSVYGRYDNEGTMLNYAINQYMKKEKAKFSAGTQLWDYLHEEDVGMIFYLLGERVTENKVYCIASGESRPLREFVLELKEFFDTELDCEFSQEEDNDRIISLQTDISGLVRDIGFKPRISFEEGILDILKFKKIIE